MSEQQQNF